MNRMPSKSVVLLAGVFVLAVGLPGRGLPVPWDCGPPVYFVDYQNPSPGAQTTRTFLFSTTNVIPPVAVSYSAASSTGTSDCSGFVGASLLRLERQQFLATAHEQLVEESARGQGPHLSGLATLMGCPPRHHPQFAHALRGHHAVLFEEAPMEPADSERLLVGITRVIERDRELSASCHLHG